jgi:hypothetical protein
MMRGHHDMGGLPAGPVDRNEHVKEAWEKRVDALARLLSEKKLRRVDEARRAIEALPPDAYDRMTYYERWMAATAQLLLERGVLTADELGRKMEEVRAREAAR